MVHFDRNSLVTRVLILFVVFNVVSIFVFSFYMVQQDHQRVAELAEESILEIAMEKAHVIDLIMKNVAYTTESLANWTTEYINTTSETKLKSGYIRKPSGVLYRKSKGESWEKTHSAIFFPANIELTDEQIRIINATEKLEPLFNTMHRRSDYYQWSYIATEDGLLRFFPYTGIEMYKPDHQQKGDPFYVVANEINNPDRMTVWTKPYIDFLGTGWMISCSSPIYVSNEFFGVACSDVRLDTIKSIFLEDFRLSESGFAYLLDNEGGIIFYPDILPEGKTQGQQFLSNILKNFSISSGYKDALSDMLNDKGDGIVSYISEEGKKKIIAYSHIEDQKWTLAVEINYEDYMTQIKLAPSNLFLYVLLISATLLLFSLFMYQQYSKPITTLKEKAEKIAKGDFGPIEAPSKYTEIKALSDAFNTMSAEINTYTGSLIQKNKEIESIFNSINGLLMIINTNYEIIIMNDKGQKALFDKNSDPVGQKCYQALVNRESPCKGCKVSDVIDKSKRSICRLAIKREIISNSYFPIQNEDKAVVEVVVHSQRITKSVLMEKEFIQKEKLAGIGQISSAIAHELKNPLAIIKGAVYLANAYTKESNDQRINEALHIISTTVDNAEKTIYNLLDYSGPGSDYTEWIDVTKIVNQILFLSNRERIKKDIYLNLEFDPDPLLYYGQAEPLKNILQNLITNALNALQEGGKLSIAGQYEDSRNGSELVLTITDNGPGISEQILREIYKPFITTDNTGKGTGLGLWITKLMVDKMKGEIYVDTKPGEGTKFIIKLPVMIKDAETEDGIYRENITG